MIRWSTLPLLAIALLLPSCGGSSSTDATGGTGSAAIVLTDAASDEIDVFEVDVTDITLTKANGSAVSVLARRARVDFAELQSVGELVLGVGLEAGFYESLKMTLDFANAQVCIVDKSTQATILDAAGNVLNGTIETTVTFPRNARPRVIAGRNHLFNLDLDLDRAVAVDAADNEVTFSPVLDVTLDPDSPKPTLMRGVLTSVGTDSITLERRTPNDEAIGSYTIAVTSSTVFQIDGAISTGTAGLTTIGGFVNSRVYVQGTLSTTEQKLTALAIETGAGTRGNGQDWVVGHIVARTGAAGSDATLTVLGRSYDGPGGTVRINTSHTINVSKSMTKVLRRGAGNSLDSDALQVGQLITAFGTLTSTTLDATAATGVVRMHRTSLFGVAAGTVSSDTITLNVSRIGLRPIARFNFDVSGTTQLTATAMTVDTDGLDASGVAANSRIRAIGWLNPVGVTTDADFDAVSLVNNTGGNRLLLCQWLPARTDAITATSTELTLAVANAWIKSVADGFSPVALTDSPAPTVTPASDTGAYVIIEDGALESHREFAPFAESLTSRISSTSPVARIAALGTFNETEQVLSATVVTVVLR